MDTGTGHIWDLSKGKIEGIKGKLVEWQAGEKVEVKGCLFEVIEIHCFPEDKIVLKGTAKENLIEKLQEKIVDEEEPPKESYREGLKNFLK